MPRAAKLGMFFSFVAVGVGLIVFTVMAFLRTEPPTINFAENHKAGQPVHLTLQTVGTIGFGPHPTWVSYLVKAPNGVWVHSTLWNLPAHTKIDVTIDQYDTGGPIRNQQLGLVTGTTGGSMLVNGKRTTLIDSNVGNGIAHTFSIPTLGISVPLLANSSSAKNICSSAPCTFASAHNIIKFSFTTPGVGQYPWQCFVPCGAGFLYGNGGPMQTIGYMDGFLKVID